jgi:hypothetical protein
LLSRPSPRCSEPPVQRWGHTLSPVAPASTVECGGGGI